MGKRADRIMDKADSLDRSDTASMPSGPVDRTNPIGPLLAGGFFLILTILGLVNNEPGLWITCLILLLMSATGVWMNTQRARRRRDGIGPGPR